MRRSHTINLSIACPCDEAYAYLAKPANFEAWTAVKVGSFRPLPNGDWEGETQFGFRHFRFTAPNAFGVLDHAIFEPGGEVRFNPMRVTPNDEGTDLTFIFFKRPGRSDAEFASAIEWVTTDLLTLKSILEARG